MDDFNAKKSRANKLRQDKYRDRPKKHVDSGHKGGTGDSKVGPQTKSVQEKNEKESEVKTTDTSTELLEEDTRSFTKRKLVSNWDRYEEPVDINRFQEEIDSIGVHFEELMSIPISGGHMKMKHEHEWEKEKSELQMPWFQLDIRGVEQNLSTISFCKRQNIPQNIFSENQLQRMMVRSTRNATSVAEVNASILKVQNLHMPSTGSSQADIKTKSAIDSSILDIKCSLTHIESPEVNEGNYSESQDLDDILALHESSSKPSSVITAIPAVDVSSKGAVHSPSYKEDMQPSLPSDKETSTTNTAQPSVSLDDWLDSILDD